MNTLVPSFFDWIFFILAGIEDMHESLDEFEFQQICAQWRMSLSPPVACAADRSKAVIWV